MKSATIGTYSENQGSPVVKEFVIQRYLSETPRTPGRKTLLRIDDEGVVLYADHHAEAVLGYTPEDLEGQDVHRLLASPQDDPFVPGNWRRIEKGHSLPITLRHKDGFFYTACLSLRLNVRDSDQAARARITLQDDLITDPHLQRSAECNAGFGIWKLDISTNAMAWTEGMFRLLELRPDTEITTEQALFYCQTSQNRLRAMFRRCIRTGKPFSTELSIMTARQNLRKVQLNARVLKQGSRVQQLGGTLVDRTHELLREQAHQHAEQILAATTMATQDLVAAVDLNLTLLHCNRPYAQQFANAFSMTPKPGDNLIQLLHNRPNERRLMEQLWQRAFERDGFVVEMPLTRQNQDLPVYEFHYRRLTNSLGETSGAVHVARNISRQPSQVASTEYLARHDPATGLLNRRGFMARLAQSLEQQKACSLLYLDLDGFAQLDDLAGNETCDRYLRELAATLGIRIRQQDMLAHIFGDTFAVLIEHSNANQALKIAEDIRVLIEQFVFEWQEQVLQTTASGGLLILAPGLPADPEQLLAQASELCHDAKTSGRNRIHTGQAITRHSEALQASQHAEQIRRALDNDHLILEFQSIRPIASATWGEYIEILCRIPADDESRETLHPDQYLPVTERFDLGKPLDRQVIRQTLAWLAQYPALEPRLKYCGFNLTLASVLDDTFADFMEDMLRDSAFLPGCFCMEISEAHASQYPDETAVLCDALHRIGCKVALDGAGASVESYHLVARLPVDIVKLDRRMMQGLRDNPVQMIMVEALHRITEEAGKTTVATFIECDDTLRKARTLGIDYGQGLRLAQPRPLQELTPPPAQWHAGADS